MTGKQLRSRRRTRLKLSQEALARELGMSVFTISRYEQEHAPIPRVVAFAVHWLCTKPRPNKKG